MPERHLQLDRLRGRIRLVEEGGDVGGECQVIAQHESPSHDVRVPGHVLRGRVHHGVRSQVEGTLQNGGREGVIDHQQAAHLVSQLRDGGDVGHREKRVRRGFHPDDLGASPPNRARRHVHVGQIHRLRCDALGGFDDAEQFVRAPVHVGRVHDLIPRSGQQANERVFRAHSGRESEAVPRAFQGRDCPREGVGRRVSAAAVLVAVAQLPGPVLNVGGGDVDREDDVAGHRIRSTADVNGQRCKVVTVEGVHALTLRGVQPPRRIGSSAGRL